MVRVPVFIRCAAVVVAGIVISACRTEQAYEKPLVPVKVAAVETYSDSSTLKYSGSVEPQSRTDLAFRVGGYVQQLGTVRDANGAEHTIQEGDSVAAGTVLARLRETDYIDKVNQAKSALDQAKSALDQARAGVDQARFGLKAAEAGRDKAKLDFDRATNLFSKQSLTKPDMDGAKAAYDAAQANVDSVQAQIAQGQAQIAQGQARIAGAQAQLDEGELALRDCVLVAPSAGVVLKRNIEIGSFVGPGIPVVMIMDVSVVKVVFGAPDVLVNKLRLGRALPTTTEAIPGVTFSGRITRISPAADVRTRVFDVEVTVSNKEGRLRPGMIASIELQDRVSAKALPVVPLPAVSTSEKDPKIYTVFVVEHKDGRDFVHERTVQLGDPLGNRIAVIAGVRPSENVVVSGTTLVRDGEAVQIIP